MNPKRLFIALALCLACVAGRAAPAPTILVTDIGTDIDDLWALGLILRSPELDLKLVMTDSVDTRYRAAVAARFLQAAGRTDVPVAVGPNEGPTLNDKKTHLGWLGDYDLARYPGHVYLDGIHALYAAVQESPVPVTLVAIGPVPGLARALRAHPDIANRCRLVGMFGSIAKGYGGGPVSAEWNVKVDPASFREVMAAPWRDVLITPLDTCGLVSLSGPGYLALKTDSGDPMVSALIAAYRDFLTRQDWMKPDLVETRTSTLYDAVAAYLAFSEDLVNVQRVSFEVTDDGFTRPNPKGPYSGRFALSWKDEAAFESLLAGRLRGK
jgi:inosine-uridine nucleoside N-ribohydrolase